MNGCGVAPAAGLAVPATYSPCSRVACRMQSTKTAEGGQLTQTRMSDEAKLTPLSVSAQSLRSCCQASGDSLVVGETASQQGVAGERA